MAAPHSMMDLIGFLNMQRQLQINMKIANPTQGGDPFEMDDEELARFITWNHSALIVELGEAMQEVGWKPWASARYVNHPEAMQEMVDAWHFFLNMLLGMAAYHRLSTWEMGVQFTRYYEEKNAKNLQRQVEGYDGLSSKCPQCKRELSESGCTEQYCQERGMNMPQPGHDQEKVDQLREEIEGQSSQRRGSLSAQELAAEQAEAHRLLQEQRATLAADPPSRHTPTGPSMAEEALARVSTPVFPDMVNVAKIGGKAAKIIKEVAESGEPIFILRAKDIFSIQAVGHYIDLLEKYGPEAHDMAIGASEQNQVMRSWQRDNVSMVRYPD